MPAAPRISPTALFTPDAWVPFQDRSRAVGPWLVLHCWGVIGLAMAAGIIWPWLIPLSVAVIGTRQLGLAILMHEAAHGGLSSNRSLNDGLGQWLCAVPVGADLNVYRPYHLSHHKYAQQAEDPDLVLSAPFPVTPASLRRKIIRDLTGQTFFKQRVLFALRSSSPKGGSAKENARSSRPTGDGAKDNARDEDMAESAVVTGRSIAPFLLINAAMLLVLALAGVWWAYFVLWLLPLATWFPMVTRIRNIAEHACVEGSSTMPCAPPAPPAPAGWNAPSSPPTGSISTPSTTCSCTSPAGGWRSCTGRCGRSRRVNGWRWRGAMARCFAGSRDKPRSGRKADSRSVFHGWFSDLAAAGLKTLD